MNVPKFGASHAVPCIHMQIFCLCGTHCHCNDDDDKEKEEYDDDDDDDDDDWQPRKHKPFHSRLHPVF